MSTQNPSGPQDAANPLAGLFNTSTQSTAGDWNTLSEHEKKAAWGGINDVFMQILGRPASMAEAQKYYSSGISNYALGQQLMMSKEFTHTGIFHQLQRGYAYELQQFVGGNFKLSTKQAQSFAAHNYTTTDIQAWVYAHPHIYVHSNDFQTRVGQMRDVYQQVFGIDPYASGNLGTHKVQIDTNAKKPGIQGHQFGEQANDPLLAHIHQAALHFQTTDQYKAWLMNTPLYKSQAVAKLAPGAVADASLTLDSRSRPIQPGLATTGQPAAGSTSVDRQDVAQ